jgi:hypothetical protein
MHDINSTVKRLERRARHLETRLRTGESNASDHDTSELKAIRDALRVMAVYNDARGDGGSHLENILNMVHDVVDDTLEVYVDQLDGDTIQRLQQAREKCREGLEQIRRLTSLSKDAA